MTEGRTPSPGRKVIESRCPWCDEEVRRDDRGVFGRKTNKHCASSPVGLHGYKIPHPQDCSCAIPCRSCGHESEQHAGSLYGGTGPRRCRVDGCKCKGCYIGSTPAKCKEKPDV
jgi:hypothetical protein